MIILSAVGSALRPLRYASRPFCSAKPSVDGRKMHIIEWGYSVTQKRADIPLSFYMCLHSQMIQLVLPDRPFRRVYPNHIIDGFIDSSYSSHLLKKNLLNKNVRRHIVPALRFPMRLFSDIDIVSQKNCCDLRSICCSFRFD